MLPCAFCDPEPNRVILRTETILSLVSNPRLAKGHALVVPRRHVERLSELEPDELGDLWLEAVRLSVALPAHGFGEGYEVRVKFEPYTAEGPVHVHHLHAHVIPRTKGDGLFGATETGRNAGAFGRLSPMERDNVIAALQPETEKGRP